MDKRCKTDHITAVNPKEVGADRIVDAVAAYERYGGPVLVLDFGTATTYDLIGEDGSFEAGITSPGIEISAKALWQDAAKLLRLPLKSRNPFWQRKQSAVCRQVWCMAILDRWNIL